jgi:hypothetical protein
MSRSARDNIAGGIVRPRALAAFRLIVSSISEFISTGVVAGFPLEDLVYQRAACRPLRYEAGP